MTITTDNKNFSDNELSLVNNNGALNSSIHDQPNSSYEAVITGSNGRQYTFKTRFNDLPAELQLMVMKRLHSSNWLDLSLTCSSWRILVFSSGELSFNQQEKIKDLIINCRLIDFGVKRENAKSLKQFFSCLPQFPGDCSTLRQYAFTLLSGIPRVPRNKTNYKKIRFTSFSQIINATASKSLQSKHPQKVLLNSFENSQKIWAYLNLPLDTSHLSLDEVSKLSERIRGILDTNEEQLKMCHIILNDIALQKLTAIQPNNVEKTSAIIEWIQSIKNIESFGMGNLIKTLESLCNIFRNFQDRKSAGKSTFFRKCKNDLLPIMNSEVNMARISPLFEGCFGTVRRTEACNDKKDEKYSILRSKVLEQELLKGYANISNWWNPESCIHEIRDAYITISDYSINIHNIYYLLSYRKEYIYQDSSVELYIKTINRNAIAADPTPWLRERKLEIPPESYYHTYRQKVLDESNNLLKELGIDHLYECYLSNDSSSNTGIPSYRFPLIRTIGMVTAEEDEGIKKLSYVSRKLRDDTSFDYICRTKSNSAHALKRYKRAKETIQMTNDYIAKIESIETLDPLTSQMLNDLKKSIENGYSEIIKTFGQEVEQMDTAQIDSMIFEQELVEFDKSIKERFCQILFATKARPQTRDSVKLILNRKGYKHLFENAQRLLSQYKEIESPEEQLTQKALRLLNSTRKFKELINRLITYANSPVHEPNQKRPRDPDTDADGAPETKRQKTAL